MALKQLSDLFDAVIAIEDHHIRDQFLQEQCHDNPELLAEVSALVASHFQGNPLLESPTQVLDLVQSSSQDHESEGALVGNFKLLQKIGEGGMGVVFMAEQLRPIRRKVAFKIIREGMNSKQIIARFEAEREALARLDHPNVTRILDAGVTNTGRPYFVMELVRGTSITEYCNTHRVSIEQRLELLEQVCLVMHHAHQKGIVHRDVKPSNVMITLHDGVPVPKVIDFGIAKALDRPLTEQTLFTRYGDLIGTPEYMSPEQAEMSGLDLDVRTDIYSLGVLLYELLTGSTPITSAQIHGKGLLKIFETIRDCQTENPSTRITRITDTASTIADQRQSNPIQLRKILSGELDWITMKAIAKDRNERYESAAAMAKDIRRYLRGEPVEAAAPSFAYHASKFFQKHRTACIVAISCTCMLITSTAFSIYWAISSYSHRMIAESQSEQLSVAKVQAEQALGRALTAERKAERMARNEQNKAVISHAHARFLGERANELAKFITIQSAGKIEAFTTEQIPNITLQQRGAKIVNITKSETLPINVPDGVAELLGLSANSQSSAMIREMNAIRPLTQDSDEPAGSPAVQGVVVSTFATKLKPTIRLLEIILEEQRKEFGNNDFFVAQTLIQLAESLIESPTNDNSLIAENHLREAMSILDSHLDLRIEALSAKALFGRVLYMQGKTVQAESVMREAQMRLETLQKDTLDEMARQKLAAIVVQIDNATKNPITRDDAGGPNEIN
jgi:serine/threonine protein kinase